ncbi:hypothetical protein O181_122031 [Austropuccinia psidii MF-1]|uniref:Uncharacterized protein n=1 Tax=Austropuccinia psidii MF-1 TaxID=1389203 RepID=A0A9Q3KKR1_9BASI|nr:hypothetical protein [Austropuccinia psidii MF-1]
MPPFVLCGSGILSQLASPSMASSGDFDHSQTYDSCKAVEVHYPAWPRPCHQAGRQVSNVRRYLWSKKDGPFGEKFPVPDAPTPDTTLGYPGLTGSSQRDVARWTNVGGPLPVCGRPIYSSSEVPISSINNEGVVKQIYSPSHPPAKRIQSHIIHNTPRNLQPTLATIAISIPPASPNPSHTSPALNQEVRPSPIPQPRNSPMVTSQQPQSVASASRRREELFPLTFPAAQVFQCQDQWPI